MDVQGRARGSKINRKTDWCGGLLGSVPQKDECSGDFDEYVLRTVNKTCSWRRVNAVEALAITKYTERMVAMGEWVE